MNTCFTLLTAAARYDALHARDAMASPADAQDSALVPPAPDVPQLTRAEALELLALGEVIARKTGFGRQLSVRSARRAGASWSQVGAAIVAAGNSVLTIIWHLLADPDTSYHDLGLGQELLPAAGCPLRCGIAGS